MLDEIDKVGADFRGDPSSLCSKFLILNRIMHFVTTIWVSPLILSNVMFMTTANVLDTIQPPLRDRMEIIRLSGYTEEEKLEIAKRHLVAEAIRENGFTGENIDFANSGIKSVISGYTREAGFRT